MARQTPRRPLTWLIVAAAILWSTTCLGIELIRHTVDVDGHPIAVWEKSPVEVESVMLLIHGRTWSTRPDFDLQVPGESVSLMDGLVAQGVATYGVDLRGYGATPRDATGWLTPARAAADVAEVLRWVARQRPERGAPHVFGWSYGSMVAQLTVQAHPELVQSLMLFGYPVRPGIATARPTSSDTPPRHPTTAEAAASDFITPGAISGRSIDAFVQAALATDPVRADWRELEQWQALAADKVVVPTLLLEGEHDPLAIDAVHSEFFAKLGTTDKLWAVIPGGDHAAFMERPRAYFLKLVDAFMHRDSW